MKYKLIMENWKRYLNEASKYSKHENAYIKEIYLKYRFLVNKIKEAVHQDSSIVVDAVNKKVSPRKVKKMVDITPWKSKAWAFTLDISSINEKYKDLIDRQAFNIITDTLSAQFYSAFEPGKDSVTAGMNGVGKVSIYGTIHAIKDKNTMLYFKSVIQHELEHIIHAGSPGFGGGSFGEIVGYLIDAGEGKAHAKQFAYILFKSGIDKFDLNKDLLKKFKLGDSWENYRKIIHDINYFKNKYQNEITPQLINKLELFANDFMKIGQMYLDSFHDKYGEQIHEI